MTPRRLDPAVIQERLREIQLLLADLVEVGKVDAERLRRDYLEVDHGKVSAAIPLALEQYSRYVRHVARWLRDHEAHPS